MNLPMVSIIGAGHMGSSLIGGLIKDGHPAGKIWASDTDSNKLKQLEDSYHIQTTTDNDQAVAAADVVIFAIKPQFFSQVARRVANALQARKPLILSIAAGIRIKNIEQWVGESLSIVRSMPNTPALVGCGATALFANDNVDKKQRGIAESILRAVGLVVWVDQEKDMDIVTALSGSGPAYYFLMMEALQQAAEDLGLAPEVAKLLTLQTALGAARMALESEVTPATLREQVTSKGGTTEKALSVLEENKMRHIFKKALEAATHRSEELAKLLGEEN